MTSGQKIAIPKHPRKQRQICVTPNKVSELLIAFRVRLEPNFCSMLIHRFQLRFPFFVGRNIPFEV